MSQEFGDNIRFTLLYIPHDGLHFDGGEFFDGRQERIAWRRSIPLYKSHARAVAAKERILAKHPDAYRNGQLVVLRVDVKEID